MARMARATTSSRGFHTVTALLLAIVIAIIGFTAYAIHARNKVDLPPYPGPSKESVVHADTDAGRIIIAVRTALEKDFKTQSSDSLTDKQLEERNEDDWDDDNGLVAGILHLSFSDNVAYYKVSGEDFFVPPSASPRSSSMAIEYSGADAASGARIIGDSTKAIFQALIGAGLQKETAPGYSHDGTETYVSSTAVCQVNAADRYSTLATVDCSAKQDFAGSAAWTKPFYEAYRQAEPEKARQPLHFWANEVKSSRTAGYETADISIRPLDGGEATGGAFYRKTGGTWKFFGASITAFPCSQYEADPEAKAAFKGEKCLRPDAEYPESIE